MGLEPTTVTGRSAEDHVGEDQASTVPPDDSISPQIVQSATDLRYPDRLTSWEDPSSMLPRFGLGLRLFARRYFRRVRVDPGDIRRLHELQRQGTVIHVLPSTSVLDTLLLNSIFRREGLPLARFLGGVRLLAFWPIIRQMIYMLKSVFGKLKLKDPVARFEDSVRSGSATVLYVKKPKQFFFGGKSIVQPYLDALVRIQKEQKRPIFIVPELIVWKQAVARPKKTIWDQVFGDPDAPGAIRKLLNFVRHSRKSFLSVGNPIEISKFLSEQTSKTEHAAEILRTELLHKFNLERRAMAGPRLKRARQVRDEIMRNEDFNAVLDELAVREGKSAKQVRKEVRSYLKEMAADLTLGMVSFFNHILTFAFRRMYRDVHVEPGSLERIKEAGKKGPVIFLPCHRSHVDYLVLSYVMHNYGMVTPHIAAGSNLDFFPVGPMFRRAGAFYIRRSFRDNRVYSATFRAYIRKLVKEGVFIEFFIEGGRSRTGKSIPPRFGILRELIMAETSGAASNIQLLPVGISYEKIVEDQAYGLELSGAKKRKESLGALLKTPKFLTDKYGRLTVNFGDPISIRSELEKWLPEDLIPKESAPTQVAQPIEGAMEFTDVRRIAENAFLDEVGSASPEFNDFVTRLGYLMLREINRNIYATPTALVAWALLTNPRRGVTREELIIRVGFLIDTVAQNKVVLAPTIANAVASRRTRIDEFRSTNAEEETTPAAADVATPRAHSMGVYRIIGEAVESAIDEAIRMFRRARFIHEETFGDHSVYLVRAEQRISVDRYRNTIMHGLVQECLLAMAILRTVDAKGRFSRSKAESDCRFLSRVLKYEFVYDPELSFEEAFSQTWDEFQEHGWITQGDDHAQVVAEHRPILDFLRRSVIHFVEAYHLVAVRAEALHDQNSEKDFLEQALREGEHRYSAGTLFARESCNLVTFKNAIRVFEELGALEISREGRKRAVRNTGTSAATPLNKIVKNLEVWARWR